MTDKASSAPDYGAVIIESVTKCFGNCDGCALTEQQRRDDETNKGGPMSWATQYAREALAPVVRTRPGGGAYVVLGQGEHLEVEPVETVADWAAASMPNTDGLTEFTTALLMPNARAKELLRRLSDRSVELGQPLLPNIVFSPKKVEVDGFGPKYLENIATTIEIFGTSDFTINVGPDVLELLPPRRLHEMVVGAGLKLVEINLIPTIDSAGKLGPRYRELIGWMKAFGEQWLEHRDRYWVPYMATIAQLSRFLHGCSLAEVKDFLTMHFTDKKYLTMDGNVYLCASGGSAVVMPLNAATGFAPVQTGYAKHDPQAIQRYGERLVMRLWSEHQRYEACRSCPHTAVCVASSFTPALRLAAPSATREKSCPIGVSDLIESSRRGLVERNDGEIAMYDRRLLQRGIVSHRDLDEGSVDSGLHEDAKRFTEVVAVERKSRLGEIPVVVQRT